MPYINRYGRRMKLKKLKQSLSSTGYYRVSAVNGNERLVHRIVAKQYLIDWNSSLEVDHVNGNKLDNRVENLRLVDKSQQSRGYQTPRGGSSKYRGVYFNKHRNRFDVYANKNGIRYRRIARTEKEAALMFDELANLLGYSQEALNVNNFLELK